METLEPLLSPSGHDAYCHVCWEPTFRFWCAKESPDYTRCGVGDFTAQTCPNAVGPARQKAVIARLKDAGLWIGSLGASLAAEATTAATDTQPCTDDAPCVGSAPIPPALGDET